MKIIYLLVLLEIIFASGNHASNHDHPENFGLETMIALSKLASTETEDSTLADDLVNPVKIKEMMDVMKMMEKIPTDSKSVEKMKEIVEVMDKLSADMKNIKKMTEMAVVMNKLPLDLNIDMMSKSMTSSNKKSDSDSIDVNDIENEIERMSTISENLKKMVKSQSAENLGEDTVSFDREVESFEDPDIHLQIKGNSFVVLVDDMPIFSGKHKNITIRFINGEGAIYLDELVPENPYDGEVIDVVASDDEQILGESSLEEELYSLDEHDEGLLIEPKGKIHNSSHERVKRSKKSKESKGKNPHKHHDEHHDKNSKRVKRSYRVVRRRNLRLGSNFQYSYPKYGQAKYHKSSLNYHEICKDYHHVFH